VGSGPVMGVGTVVGVGCAAANPLSSMVAAPTEAMGDARGVSLLTISFDDSRRYINAMWIPPSAPPTLHGVAYPA
jgi:hypothetical protein